MESEIQTHYQQHLKSEQPDESIRLAVRLENETVSSDLLKRKS